MQNLVLDRQILGEPKQKYWISYILQRIKKNKNFLGFISGPTGSGKSWSSLSICQDLDPDFNINRVVFTGLELMNLINDGNLKKGSAICFEEAGVEMNARQWASITNRMLNYLIQTFRHRNFILILNSPFIDFIDSATRKLFHAEFNTVAIDTSSQECKLKPQLIQYNGRLQKFYYRRLKVITDKGVIPVSTWRVHKPTASLLAQYEEKKLDFTNTLNQRIYNELLAIENKATSKKTPKEMTDIQRDVYNKFSQGMTIKQIATTTDRNPTSIYQSLKLIKRKGIIIPPAEGDTPPLTHNDEQE